MNYKIIFKNGHGLKIDYKAFKDIVDMIDKNPSVDNMFYAITDKDGQLYFLINIVDISCIFSEKKQSK